MKRVFAWFTLVEVVVTTMIIAFLIGVLFSIFNTISRLSVKIQLERWIHNELIFFMQTIQNIVDEGDYELTWYDLDSLWSTYGFSDELLLSWSDFTYKVLRTCNGSGSVCSLSLEKFDPFLLRTDYFQLTDPNRVNIDTFYIKIIPYGSQSVFSNIQHQWFWLFIEVSTPLYDPDAWWFRVSQRVETFFNIRKY